jgi:ubiquinone/menaquinone biosynthesis C-methylase UbiE
MTLKLNVGAGKQRLEGYVGLDYVKGKGVDKIIETAWKLPYRNGEVDEIYTSHMIEHIEQFNLDKLLNEFNRVLKSGGILEIVCPDLEVALRKFLESSYHFRWTFGIRRIFGFQRKEKGDVHYSGWTKERFRKVLPEFGFRILEIRNQPSRFRRDERMWPNGDLYVKAVKL